MRLDPKVANRGIPRRLGLHPGVWGTIEFHTSGRLFKEDE
jgi:hypothetical protein